jgi:hypothetical protein
MFMNQFAVEKRCRSYAAQGKDSVLNPSANAHGYKDVAATLLLFSTVYKEFAE